MSPSNVPVTRFSTDDIAPPDRFAVWREVLGRAVFNVDIEQNSPGPFRAEATIRVYPGLSVLSASSSPVVYRRSAAIIHNDDIMFSLGATRGAYAKQRNREASAQDGDALLMLGAEPCTVARSTEGAFKALRVPRAALAPQVRDLEGSCCRRIPADTPALQMLTHYLAVLEDSSPAVPELQRSAVTHIIDLIGLTVGATRDGTALAESGGVRAARLKAIKDDIERNVGDESLSVGTIAARHHVTVRYVQRLFEESGITFTTYLIGARLVHARRLMTDPQRSDRSLTAIAFDSGFSDLSYFNRAFRRQFGATPSDVRAAARSAH